MGKFRQRVTTIHKSSDAFKEAIETSIMAIQDETKQNLNDARFSTILSGFVALSNEMQFMKLEDRYILACSFLHSLSCNELMYVEKIGVPRP